MCCCSGIGETSEKEEAKGHCEFPKCQMLSQSILILVPTMWELASALPFSATCSGTFLGAQWQPGPKPNSEFPLSCRDSPEAPWLPWDDFHLDKRHVSLSKLISVYLSEYPCCLPCIWMATFTFPNMEMSSNIKSIGFDLRQTQWQVMWSRENEDYRCMLKFVICWTL